MNVGPRPWFEYRTKAVIDMLFECPDHRMLAISVIHSHRANLKPWCALGLANVSLVLAHRHVKLPYRIL